jgi:UrcA family protein
MQVTTIALLSASAEAAPLTQDLFVERTRVVHFDDLDLNYGPGVETLYARIKSAAEDVCDPVNARDAWSSQMERSCKSYAIAHAIADINVSNLTSYYRSKWGSTELPW